MSSTLSGGCGSTWRAALSSVSNGLLLLILASAVLELQVTAIRDVYAEPFGLQASAQVPFLFSFTTGEHAAYGQPDAEDGVVRMMLSLQLTVYCRPEIEPCTYVELGENNDCRKVLEAPKLPLLQRCILGPFGIMLLQLRGTLEKKTQYNLLVLGTLPPAGKRIQKIIVKVLKPGAFLDITQQVAYEEATVDINPEYVTGDPSSKQITGFELVTPVVAYQDVTLQQYTFKVTGSGQPFAKGDQLRIFSSPFIFPDEGLSFGGPCDGFDVSGFASPLRDVTCKVESMPSADTRVGYNVVTLTFGALSTLAAVPQFFRVALNTPKQQGSFGLWFIASKDTYVIDNDAVFNKVIPAIGSFFVSAVLRVTHSMPQAVVQIYGASQRLSVEISPRVNLLGDVGAPPRITISSPTFHAITYCKIGVKTPEITLAGSGTDAFCLLMFKDNMNLYVGQSVLVHLDVVNPSFSTGAEAWRVTVESGDGSMSSSATFMGWPVYTSLRQAFVVPLTMEYKQFNELDIFFCPSTTSPSESRVLILAPQGFSFLEPCDFDIILGFPHQGVQCSNPLSETGRNLFSLRMPMMTAFEAGKFYAARIYPIRNPYPGSYSGAAIDASPWRIDIVTMDGSEVLETMHNVPMGPHLRSFTVYPHALYDPAVLPSVRTPNSENRVTLQFRAAASVSTHGERLLITAPYGYRWKIGATMQMTARLKPVQIATLSYDESYPPVVAPHNQIELTLVNPMISAGSDMTVEGTVLNAPIDSLLNEQVRSANVWIVEMYEPGAGYLNFDFRHQAVIFEGFFLQAITSGSVTAWLPIPSHVQRAIMVTFRLGTALLATPGKLPVLEVYAPDGFTFPEDCAAQRLSPLHLAVDGYTSFPPGSIASCQGAVQDGANADERRARVSLSAGSVVAQRVLYVFLLEVFIPDSLPPDNTWTIRSFSGSDFVEEQRNVLGFRLATAFLSAVYHPGTADTGEDLRVGASDNRVMLSMQPASAVLVGGMLKITAPYRFSFARECKLTVYKAKHILDSLDDTSGATFVELYHDLPPVDTCLGVWNTAQLKFTETLDVSIRYAFRIAVSNPVLPHPTDWPLAQNIWRFETFDPVGAPLNTAQVQAFFLWAFARASITPLALGAGERTIVTVEVEPSLTIPPRGFLQISAPLGFVIPVPCVDFQRDTYSAADGFDPLPPKTTCDRGPGGSHVVKLRVDEFSYLSAAVRFLFRIGVINPAVTTEDRTAGEKWSISSAEEIELGEAFLERNPVVEGYPLHERLKSFTVEPDVRRAQQRTRITFEVSIPESLGTFEVVTTTQVSFLVVNMPPGFSVALREGAIAEQMPDGSFLYQCDEFLPLYPEQDYFPARADGCLAYPDYPRFRLRLSQNLLVGPDYRFLVAVMNPTLDSLRQRQLVPVNYWQVRLTRMANQGDITYTTRSTEGYRVLPFFANVLLRPAVDPLSVRTSTYVSVAFTVVTALSGAASDAFRIIPPSSIYNLADTNNGSALCQFWVAKQLQPLDKFDCLIFGDGGLTVQLRGAAQVPEESEVQVDFDMYSGNASLALGDPANTWSVLSVDINGSVWDQTLAIPGFTIYSSLPNARLIPKDISAMSYTNHAEFRFEVSDKTTPGSSLVILAPAGFVLYPMTFVPLTLPDDNKPTAEQGASLSEAIILLPDALNRLVTYSFLMTIGNPAVSPPKNEFVFEIRNAAGQTVNIDSRIPGFVVQSQFNTSLLEGQLDEPLAENFVHVTVAVRQRLVADSILTRSSCAPSVDEPVCPPRQGVNTLLVVTAPEGFVFQPTCGFWVLSRVGSRHRGLPPGSLCRADPLQPNIARVKIALSLEPLSLYEFTLQVRNAISVPLNNYWELHAVQDGVIRERDRQVAGFPLRQLRTVRVTPSTTLAGVVDNTVTVQMRSERPVTRGSIMIIVAPTGFLFDASQVASSFTNSLSVQVPAPDYGTSSIRLQLDQQDFMPPNVYFFVSMRVRNPLLTPQPNYWFFYLQSMFLDHIDLRKYFDGFEIAHKMYYCQAYPNTIPWELGTANDVSMLFVTKFPIFTVEAAPKLQNRVEGETTWELVLVAPIGFTFPTENKYSDYCSGFRRWGGKDSYDQLHDTSRNPLICQVRTARSVRILVPQVLMNETRYSFRLNVTSAQSRDDIALQDPWRLSVLESGQILHVGESPSPLLGTYYEAQWFWASGTDGLSSGY